MLLIMLIVMMIVVVFSMVRILFGLENMIDSCGSCELIVNVVMMLRNIVIFLSCGVGWVCMLCLWILG